MIETASTNATVDDDTRRAYVALTMLLRGSTRHVAVTATTHGVSDTLAAVAALRPTPTKLADALRRAEQVLADTARIGARIVVPGDAEWPHQVNDLNTAPGEFQRAAAPLCLWLHGPLNLVQALRRSVAVTGTTAPTEYGKTVAQQLGYGLADAGYSVITGGMLGIDRAADSAAATAVSEGPRLAVIPTALNVQHPQAHAAMFDRLAAEGLLISPLPLGTEPHRLGFVRSSDVLAALTSATLIVEATVRSRCLRSARLAASIGRHVMAVPGPVTSAYSTGPHDLIRSGTAHLITDTKGVIRHLNPTD